MTDTTVTFHPYATPGYTGTTITVPVESCCGALDSDMCDCLTSAAEFQALMQAPILLGPARVAV